MISILAEWVSNAVDNVCNTIWKVCPFMPGNREWAAVLLKTYLCCLSLGMNLACLLNVIEGDKWLNTTIRSSNGTHHGAAARGNTALDECIWFVFCTMHGISFGEFMPRGAPGRVIACICAALGYWFVILMMCIVLLSQLPGEKTPTMLSVLRRTFNAVWPSYLIVIGLIAGIGVTMGPFVSKDPYGPNKWPTGFYWMWCVVHRMPYGDIFPNSPEARAITFPAGIIGLLYMPYALALVAVRCPTEEQHAALLGHLCENPEDALGHGYIVPKGGNYIVPKVPTEEQSRNGSARELQLKTGP